jgi:hypothetical protein
MILLFVMVQLVYFLLVFISVYFLSCYVLHLLGVCSFCASHSFQYAWCSCDDFLVSVRKWC